jgi:predicted transcriptional regulator
MALSSATNEFARGSQMSTLSTMHRQDLGRHVGTVISGVRLMAMSDTEIDELRRLMLGRHARYTPVMSQRTLMGVISFYDVAKAVVDSQDFENRMLKAYIRDWPAGEDEQVAQQPQP